MLHYEHFVARHGEIAVQSLIETIERYERVRALPMYNFSVPSLEERRQRLMQDAVA